MTRSRVLAYVALALFVAALLIDALWARANRWLDSHALTTDLIASAFFALLVSFVIDRISRQREAARMTIPTREAVHRIVFAGQQATSHLRVLIEARAAAVDGEDSGAPDTLAHSDPLDWLQTPRSREIAQDLYTITSVEPAWLATTLAATAELLADLASERIVTAGQILTMPDPGAAQWALEDADTLRCIASTARTVASYHVPRQEATPSPMMKAIAEAARAELPNLPDQIASVVRDGIAAEDLGIEILAEAARERLRSADKGVKSIASMLAARENLPPSLKMRFAL